MATAVAWARRVGIFAAATTSQLGLACACGCGIFDVGTGSMFPSGTGGLAFLEYDFMDQNQNHFQSATAPAAQNGDKDIRTDFITAGAQYMFDRSNGMQIDVPYWQRHFKTTDPSGDIVASDHAALGDIRIRGLYTGFSEDMSTGISYGLKLATGDSTYANFDPDTQIGSGSTDLLLGAYHIGKIDAANQWVWYSRLSLDQPLLSKVNYIPGNEIDAAVGSYYNGWAFAGGYKIAPVLGLVAAVRGNDNGNQADTADSGYKRLLVVPGLEADVDRWRLYADVGFPIYEYFYGNQLAAKVLYKVSTSVYF